MTPTNEQRELTYQPLDELIEHPRNPKTHDTATVTHSFARFGTLDPIVLDGRTGYILSGHGRAKALTQMRENGHEPPEGIHTDEQGRWLVPVMSGWSSRTDYDAHAAMIALNRTTELGGWDNSSLVQLLEDLSQIDDGLTGVGYSDDDVEQLRAQLSALDEPEYDVDSSAQPSKRSLGLDLVFTGSDPYQPESLMAARSGWQLGLITTEKSALQTYYSLFPKAARLSFMDNPWQGYDHESHVEGVRLGQPAYATARDIMTKDQCIRAGVDYFPLSQVLEMAEEISQHTDNVILIPKYDCLDELPDTIGGKRVVLGYSMPSSYGRSTLPVEALQGWPVHLLGGSWKRQRAALATLGDDVVSLDNNYITLAAQYGTVMYGDGTYQRISNLLERPLHRPYYAALSMSLDNIVTELRENFGVELAGEDSPSPTVAQTREGDVYDDNELLV